MNPEEKGDEKFISFLNHMHLQSKCPENFVDPLGQDFKPVLAKITKTHPIQQQIIQNVFQYSFAEKTKSKI
jgi:hypothetical protein